MSLCRWCQDCGARLDGYYPREMHRCPTCIRYACDEDRGGQPHVEEGAPSVPMGEAVTERVYMPSDGELLGEYDARGAA